MSHPGRRVLIVGPSWVGDMVMAQSLFIALKQREPNCLIDVLAPAWTAAIVDRMPEVNSLIDADLKHGKLGLGERWRLGKSLRERAYDQAILLPNSLKSALIPAIARIPIRTGYIGEQRWGLVNDIRRLNKAELPMTVQRFVALGNEPAAPAPELKHISAPRLLTEATAAEQLATRFEVLLDKPILVLCPGAEFGPSKQWPETHYVDLAKHYLGHDWRVLLLGSDKDQVSCVTIANSLNSKQVISLAGQTSLPQAVDLMSLASLVVANDSGLMHIAAALQKPLVAVYGSTDPGHTPPLSPNHKIARLNLECSPCFQRHCPLQHHDCMQKLTADQVITLIEKLRCAS